jgi:predicted ATP-dependent endonuclease of OLD family
MPPMTSLLNSVQLGYDDVSFTTQGLGYRNLILQVVMINSLITASESVLSVLTIEEPEAHLSYENQILLGSYLHNTLADKQNVQLIYSTHSTQFINKLELENVLVFNKGEGYSLFKELESGKLNYLSKNPNLDLFKILFSPKCILVEGISEEMLIRSYLSNRCNQLHDIEVISFHKGFTKIMDLWLKINKDSQSKLGVVRDFDDEPKARDNHERYNEYSNICVRTTQNYTLEDDVVREGNNFEKLKNYFSEKYEWVDIDSQENLSRKWKKSKAEIMLRFCQDIGSELLEDFVMPSHIADIIDWIEEETDENY